MSTSEMLLHFKKSCSFYAFPQATSPPRNVVRPSRSPWATPAAPRRSAGSCLLPQPRCQPLAAAVIRNSEYKAQGFRASWWPRGHTSSGDARASLLVLEVRAREKGGHSRGLNTAWRTGAGREPTGPSRGRARALRLPGGYGKDSETFLISNQQSKILTFNTSKTF